MELRLELTPEERRALAAAIRCLEGTTLPRHIDPVLLSVALRLLSDLEIKSKKSC